MTSRRQALVVAAGPTLNLLVAALAAAVAARWWPGAWRLALTRLMAALASLVPHHGPDRHSDGTRLLRLRQAVRVG